MSEETSPSLLAKAVKELNESDASGAVQKIKTLVKLVQANNTEVEKLQKSNRELLQEVQKLNAAGGLTVESLGA